jgi:CRISPR-associated protein Cmr6
VTRDPVPAAGPLGRLLSCTGTLVTAAGLDLSKEHSNAWIMLHRLAFPTLAGTGIELEDAHKQALLRWAAGCDLGQSPDLIKAVLARRDAALRPLRDDGRAVRLHAMPEWRLAVGLGDKANAHEIGLALHGTYGWPVIPGSSLKGLTAAWALESGESAGDIAAIFGTPRPRADEPDGDLLGDAYDQEATHSTWMPPEPATEDVAAKGAVCFMDALPAGAPVKVEIDVLTPHVKPYYDGARPGSEKRPVPPSDRHNPVPVFFLTVRGAFAIDLVGPDDTTVGIAADWLTCAADQLGVGGKTSAGYGYLTITKERES